MHGRCDHPSCGSGQGPVAQTFGTRTMYVCDFDGTVAPVDVRFEISLVNGAAMPAVRMRKTKR